jgi:hypothetical protein
MQTAEKPHDVALRTGRLRRHHGLYRSVHFFFFAGVADARKPFIGAGSTTAAADFFGFFVSRLLRFCDLAMVTSCAARAVDAAWAEKMKKPRHLNQARGS